MVKNSFLKATEFKKNMPTALEFKITHAPIFGKEKQRLISIVENFGKTGTAIISNKTPPFFGEMNDEEWGILQYKHFESPLAAVWIVA